MPDQPISEVYFTVKFKPKASWVDRIYLGNMLVEVLGTMARGTNAFEFEVEPLKKEG